jgi:LacI family transcriptional regulator, galactose operon repressor
MNAVSTKKQPAERGSKVPTLRAVADLAGCSMMTVSNVLNGVYVTPKYAERVRQAVDALGYVPNVAAQSVRGGRTRTIGLLVNMTFDPRNELMAVLDGLIREMEAAGIQVLLSLARGGPEQIDSHLRGFLGRRVDGVIYWNVEPSNVLELYKKAHVPVLGLAFRDPKCAKVPMVSVDAAPALAAMSQRLRGLGHRHAVELVTDRGPAMIEAFGTSVDLKWTKFRIGYDSDSMTEFVKSTLRERVRPTVVMTNYPSAVQLLEVCDDLRVNVPNDFSVVSVADAVGANMLKLSCVRTDHEALGHETAQAMLGALEGKKLRDVLVRDCTHWVERGSVGRAPSARRRLETAGITVV